MDKISNGKEAQQFLWQLSLRVDGDIVNKVVEVLRGENQSSLYDLYSSHKRRDGSVRTPLCGKGTIYKIKKLYDKGHLQPYIDYVIHQRELRAQPTTDKYRFSSWPTF